MAERVSVMKTCVELMLDSFIDWTMLAAAAVSTTTENNMINALHTYVSSNQDNGPIAIYFFPATGQAQRETGGSPAVGAMFSLLVTNKSSLFVSVFSLPVASYRHSHSQLYTQLPVRRA